MAEPRPIDAALDVATGTGNTAFALAPYVGRIIGLDISSGMLEQARNRAREEKLNNIEFREGSAEEFPFAEGSFSLVVSRHAPHHFRNLEKFLSEVRRVLLPGGRFVLADQISPSWRVSDWLEKWEQVRDPSHFRQRTVGQWRELIEAAGFRWVKEQIVPYELPFDWWVKQAGCEPDTVERLRRHASAADAETRHEVGLKFDQVGSVVSFLEMMLVVRGEA
jgi:ubiquinone/menaquinone biosynthesis C-methylase UbiE